ncbi:acidic proline-rich protein PRP25-like [Choloepus didactylus]|uniref:acidic proline-rich protein PRP25-like n=1 Tax=Choloepus didactylus TaxID=27675 RepID=UPI00189F7AFC|nr:acidic proline-rich protein PRP25-like [Choloepus didactylus]
MTAHKDGRTILQKPPPPQSPPGTPGSPRAPYEGSGPDHCKHTCTHSCAPAKSRTQPPPPPRGPVVSPEALTWGYTPGASQATPDTGTHSPGTHTSTQPRTEKQLRGAQATLCEPPGANPQPREGLPGDSGAPRGH